MESGEDERLGEGLGRREGGRGNWSGWKINKLID